MTSNNGRGPLQELIDSCANGPDGWLGQRNFDNEVGFVFDPRIYSTLLEEGNGCVHCQYAGQPKKTKHKIPYFPCSRPRRTG